MSSQGTENHSRGWGEAIWDDLRQAHFPFARINLNPGTLTSPSRQICAAAREEFDALEGAPLAMYQAGREALQEARELGQKIWPTRTHELAIGPPMTTAANLWTHAFAGHWPDKAKINVLTTHHEHFGCISSFANHPRMVIHKLDEAALTDQAAFLAQVEAAQPDLAIFSHLTYGLGRRLPVARWDALLKKQHPHCVVIIDVAHTIGQQALPLPAGDIMLGSTHKWLCGPSELGLTWLRRSRMHLLPSLFLTDNALDAGRESSGFEISGGQRFIKYLELAGTLRLFSESIPLRFYRRSQDLADDFASRAGRQLRAFPQIEVDRTDCAMVLLHFHDADPYPIYTQLNQDGVHVKCIKGSSGPTNTLNLLRLGFPYYETHERLGQALDLIEACCRSLL